jgi:hypothetical protein
VDASVIDGPDHQKVARDATAASIVLLKNDNNLLPLSKSTKVAAIGPYIRPSLQKSMNPKQAFGMANGAYVHSYAGVSAVMVDFLDGLTTQLTSAPLFVQGCESNQTSPDDPTGTVFVFVTAGVGGLAALSDLMSVTNLLTDWTPSVVWLDASNLCVMFRVRARGEKERGTILPIPTADGVTTLKVLSRQPKLPQPQQMLQLLRLD